MLAVMHHPWVPARVAVRPLGMHGCECTRGYVPAAAAHAVPELLLVLALPLPRPRPLAHASTIAATAGGPLLTANDQCCPRPCGRRAALPSALQMPLPAAAPPPSLNPAPPPPLRR